MSSLRLRYQTIEFGEVDIHLRTLRDNQEFQDKDGEAEKLGISSASWPLFGVVWDAGKVLAHHMCDYDIADKRILEVGCGIGLTSLLLNHRLADITATDYHPEAGNFLKENVDLNNGSHIPFERTGWADTDDGLGLFDLIIGSDPLYEREHVALLSEFIHQHAQPSCQVVIVDPGRGRKNKLSSRLVDFGFTSSQHQPENTDYLDEKFKGYILTFKRSA